VLKLGGSLLRWPGWRGRFEAWWAAHRSAEPQRGLLVVGGGGAADWVRLLDELHGLDEETAHWMCLRCMSINADAVARWLGGVPFIGNPATIAYALPDRRADPNGPSLGVVEPLGWLAWQEAQPGGAIPHRWSVTSDSIAALMVRWAGAQGLTLLKSAAPPSDLRIATAVAEGALDAAFVESARGLASVRWVNLKADPPEVYEVI
jgi:hypothetical protein